jgi:hypothetical protein
MHTKIHFMPTVSFDHCPDFFACQPAIKKENRIYEETLEPVNFFYPTFKDDMDWDSLVSALKTTRAI